MPAKFTVVQPDELAKVKGIHPADFAVVPPEELAEVKGVRPTEFTVVPPQEAAKIKGVRRIDTFTVVPNSEIPYTRPEGSTGPRRYKQAARLKAGLPAESTRRANPYPVITLPPYPTATGKMAAPLTRSLNPSAEKYSEPTASVVQGWLLEQLTTALIEAQGVTAPPMVGKLAGYREGADESLLAYLDGQRSRQGRTLLNYAALDDRHRLAYLNRLLPYGLRPSSKSRLPALTPHLVSFLLGGATMGSVESMILDAVELLQVDVHDPEKVLADAVACVSLGRPFVHEPVGPLDGIRQDFRESPDGYAGRIAKALSIRKIDKPGVDPREGHSNSLSDRQLWLIEALPPTGSFASHLLQGTVSLYPVVYQSRMASMKWKNCARTSLLFNADASPEMGKLAYKQLIGGLAAHHNVDRIEARHRYDTITQVDDMTYANALDRVFNRPWSELVLTCEPATLLDDVEVVLARAIIERRHAGKRGVRKPAQIKAQTLLGFALLTGLPIGKWIAFAWSEFERKGESYLSADSIAEVVELLETSDLTVYLSEELREELEDWEAKFRLKETMGFEAARFAADLRTGSKLMWPVPGAKSYYLQALSHGHPYYRHRVKGYEVDV